MGVNAPRADARIVVTGTNGRDSAAKAVVRAELNDVHYVGFAHHTGDAIGAALGAPDMLLFVAGAADPIAAAVVGAVAGAARSQGTLVAALIVEAKAAAPNPALLTSLRDAADMVMIIRDDASIAQIVAALR
jgi:hypothetical protein